MRGRGRSRSGRDRRGGPEQVGPKVRVGSLRIYLPTGPLQTQPLRRFTKAMIPQGRPRDRPVRASAILWLLLAVPARAAAAVVLAVCGAGAPMRARSASAAGAGRRAHSVFRRAAVLVFPGARGRIAILALAKPQAVTSLVRTAGVDLVILQDGSASMHVTDVKGDRWQRSMRFLRTLGEALRWENDRVAMALFAHMATPQIRLTKDPNTYFFFLDHLEEVAVPSRRRRHVGHQHRARHLLGPAADREG